MHSTHENIDVGAWIPHLQQALQQQLAQVSKQIPMFRDFQIQCVFEKETLLIAAESVSLIELDPQKVFWVLEQFVRNCGSKSIPFPSDRYSLAASSLPVKLCLMLAGHAQAYECHSFTLFLTDSVLASPATRPFLKQSKAGVIPEGSLNFSDNNKSATGDGNGVVRESSTPIKTVAPTTSSPTEQLTVRSSHFSQVVEFWGQVNPWMCMLMVLACFSGVIGYYALSQSRTARATMLVQPAAITPVSVVALGRIEPKGESIKLSVANAQDSRIDQLLVEEGDRVKPGQVIAILQGLDKKKAAVAQAKQNVEIARAKLAQSQAGDGKVAEVAAQQSQIARLEAQLYTEKAEKQAAIAQANSKQHFAKTIYLRYQTLYQAGAVSNSELDQKQEEFETAQAQQAVANAQLDNITSTLQKQIQQERSLLSNLSEVRPVDVNVAKAEINYALTQVALAEADLEDLYVRASSAGQILKINTRMGEQVNTREGIVELGQTDQMYAVAEVYETDVSKIELGQRATIVSENGGFNGEIFGIVDHIGFQIKKQNILDTDPAAEKDARVVEVKVRLRPEDTPKVAALTNLQVRVRIGLTESKS